MNIHLDIIEGYQWDRSHQQMGIQHGLSMSWDDPDGYLENSNAKRTADDQRNSQET